MLLLAVVIAGDRPGADVHILADGRVADVGQVRHLRALAHRGLLDLHVRAGLRALAQVRRRAQIGARAAGGAVVDARLHSHRLVHHAAPAHHGVGETRVRPDHAVLAHLRAAHQKRLWQKLHVALDAHVGTDPHLIGIDHGHARRQVLGVDAPLQMLRRLGQLDARVHAQALRSVRAGKRQHRPSGATADLQHVGEVELALGVVVAHLLQSLEQRTGVEAVEAGIALADGRLLGRGVLLLHDARHAPLRIAHDAPVAEGVVRLHRQNHHSRARFLADAHQLGDGSRRDERAVAGEDHERPIEVGQGVGAHGHRAGRAVALLLHHHVRVGLHQRDHLLALMAHHAHHARQSRFARRVHHPADKRLAQDLVRDLRLLRLHAGSRARGQHDGSCLHDAPSLRSLPTYRTSTRQTRRIRQACRLPRTRRTYR